MPKNHRGIPCYVMDASVLMKPILQEEGTQKVTEIFSLMKKYEMTVLVPDIFRYEIFNILAREISTETALKAWRNITSYQLSIIPMEEDIIKVACLLIEKYRRVSFYDASYHALAKLSKCPFITADEKYYELTRKEGNIQLLKNLKLPK